MIPDEIKRMKPLQGKERLGMNRDSEYMGAEDIDPGTEPILTIKALYYGQVTLQRGKEFKDIIVFAEESVPGIKVVRPMIVNATNRKALRKMYKAVSADVLVGKQIQIYIDHKVRDPSTGELIDGIRIRPKIPVPPRVEPIICEDCGKPIQSVGNYSAEDVAKINLNRFGKHLCAACSKKIGSDKTEPNKNVTNTNETEPEKEKTNAE